MIKSSLVKGLMIGLCMSALTTGAAFAQSVEGSTRGSLGTEVTVEENKLFSLQKEIDQVLFVDKVNEIEEKGFMVNYTGVAEDYVEIGISPYTPENEDFLYGLIGKDSVKVVEFDQSIIYATSGPVDEVKEDLPVSDADVVTTPDKEQIYTIMDEGAAEPAANTDSAAVDLEEKVYKGGEAQGEVAVDDIAQDGEEVIYYTTTAEADNANPEVQLLAEAEAVDAVKRSPDAENTEEADGVNAPMMVLVIAGAAALIGGSILIEKKKIKK